MTTEHLDLIFIFLAYGFRMACAIFVTVVVVKMLELI